MPTKTPKLSRGSFRTLLVILAEIAGAALVYFGSLTLIFFPYDTDRPMTAAEIEETRQYYAKAYAAPSAEESKDDPQTERYVRIAAAAAKTFRISERVTEFVGQYGLADKKVLDVGAGRGYLQDIATNYTGLDISRSAGRFFHKPFVLGSATAMPFENDTFDAVWSIWVIEHIPVPERALEEIRRVVRPGGYLFLMPAWNVQPFVANGYDVRPYSDFGPGGKLIKAGLVPYVYFYVVGQNVIRLWRYWWSLTGQPTRLRYRRLAPNYETYWGPDGDAVNSIDRFEMALWFTSRGDEWLNREKNWRFEFDGPLVLRVVKAAR